MQEKKKGFDPAPISSIVPRYHLGLDALEEAWRV